MLAVCDRRCGSGFPTAPLAPGLRGAGGGTVDNPGRTLASGNVRMGQRESTDNQRSACSLYFAGEPAKVDDSRTSVIDVVLGHEQRLSVICMRKAMTEESPVLPPAEVLHC